MYFYLIFSVVYTFLLLIFEASVDTRFRKACYINFYIIIIITIIIIINLPVQSDLTPSLLLSGGVEEGGRKSDLTPSLLLSGSLFLPPSSTPPERKSDLTPSLLLSGSLFLPPSSTPPERKSDLTPSLLLSGGVEEGGRKSDLRRSLGFIFYGCV